MVAGVKDMMVILLPRMRIYAAFNKMGGSLNSDDPYGKRSDRTRLESGGNAGTLRWFKPDS
jgi:hypothetical protein